MLQTRLDQVVFPSRCVNCGDDPDSTITIRRGRGIDLVTVRFWTEARAHPPVCRKCRRRRTLFGLVCGLASLGLSAAGVLAFYAVLSLAPSNVAASLMILFFMMALLWVLAGYYFARYRLPLLLDSRLLGIRISSFRGKQVSLWFRDADYAAATERLTLENEAAASGELADAVAVVGTEGTSQFIPENRPTSPQPSDEP